MSELNAHRGTSSSTSSDTADMKPRALASGAFRGNHNGSSTSSSRPSPSSSSMGDQHHPPVPPPQQQQFPSYGQFSKWGATEDDESIHYLSEPSLSEEGDSTTDHPLEEEEEDTTDDNRETPPPPPPGPPPMRNSLSSAASNGVASPGNTSLSSWESHFRPQHPHHRVRIHFSPETTTDRHQYYNNNSPYFTQYQAQRLFPPQNSNTTTNNERIEEQQQQQSGGEDASESAPPILRPQQQPTRHHQHTTTTTTSHDSLASSSRIAASSHHTNNLSYSTHSISTISTFSNTAKGKHLDDFIQDLRHNSQGALQEASGNNSILLNTSTEESAAHLDTVLRHSSETPMRATHRRISSVETELIGNTSDAHVEEQEDEDANQQTQTISTPQQQRVYPMEDDSPLVLNLSVLGDEEDDEDEEKAASLDQTTALSGAPPAGDAKPASSSTTTSNNDSAGTTDEDQQHSADDEQTQFRPPRRRTFNVAGGKPSPAHRRTRSGDGVAAALTTGGQDWVGMFKDNIPMPDGVDDDDDDDDEEEADGSPEKDNKDAADALANTGNGNHNMERAVFALGATTDATTASRAAARRQRREQRQLQRSMAEKAAEHARKQKIQRQFQEWSLSPLWNNLQHQQHNSARAADSSESNSLGSIPSTVVSQAMPTTRGGDNIIGKSRAYSAPEMPMEDETAPLRNSLDLSFSSEPGHGLNHIQPRNSVDSHKSLFSWISTSNHDHTSLEALSSPSAASPRHMIQVHPNWTPQAASLASPILQRRNQDLQRTREAQHQRSRTSIGNYPTLYDPNHSSHSWRQESEDPFRRLLLQQQQQQQQYHQIRESDSFRMYSGPSPRNSLRSPNFAGSSSNDPFNFRRHSTSSSGSGSHSTTTSEDDEDDDDVMGVMQNQCRHIHPDIEVESLEEAERTAEAELLKLGSQQHVLRGARISPFANIGRKVADFGKGKAFDRQSFLPKTSVLETSEEGNANQHFLPTYQCPRCNTIQREFFTVNSAPRQYETASGFLALSFVVYVIASLYIFGLEEGWPALDCIYFAVITLTTAGLGDFVPTTPFNKIICSIFIYFGVACIGLLLGSYIASMMDESQRRQARVNRINACPNCIRLQNIKDAAERRQLSALAISMKTPVVIPTVTGHAMPKKKHSSERTTFSQPGFPYSFNTEEDESDESFQSGNKKMKRQHNSGKDVNILGADFRSPNQSEQTPPMGATCSSSSPHSAAQVGTSTPSSAHLADQSLMAEASNTAGRAGGIRDPPSHLGVISSVPDGAGLPAPSRSPVSPTTPRHAHISAKISPKKTDLLGSPMTKQILGRQSHTRHASFDVSGMPCADDLFGRSSLNSRMYSFDAPRVNPHPPTINENVPFVPGTSSATPHQNYGGVRFEGDDSLLSSEEVMSTDESSVLSSDSYSTEESDILDVNKARVHAAKYVFKTLKEALVNSLAIIGVGCLGFWFIEHMSFVDSWYFTTVLLTTVGYGDIVPVTKGGKLFATIYILVAGTVLLNNMSMISMIPLELRKRRIERAVLTQFGDLLDDDALRELASGPLIQRLHLSRHRADGLNECTREMFALAMLVRLGKVTEEDILGTFGAFNRLDVNRDGVLNSRSIIAGMIHKSKSKANLSGMRRVSSNSNLMKTPGFRAPPAPMYGSQDRYSANIFTPAPMTTPISIPLNESTSLLQQQDTSLSMLSRSG
ncbi:Two pore potassium channel [Seminavis robusta]|uniref:Two pore potassium channel n=1 Tax=Seminavis robusta TaxID=568900 RepID=A0A9N8HDG3_9STRA|nr:Two pore potassium channel [Seminavis robusta]|eukprot:Sro426_g140490.1 Two pore potassium channel (1689) ;mRNA; f:44934-50578